MGSGLDVKIFFLLQPAGVGQGVATPLVGAFYHHFLQSLSDRFLIRPRIPFGIDFYVRQRVGMIEEEEEEEEEEIRYTSWLDWIKMNYPAENDNAVG